MVRYSLRVSIKNKKNNIFSQNCQFVEMQRITQINENIKQEQLTFYCPFFFSLFFSYYDVILSNFCFTQNLTSPTLCFILFLSVIFVLFYTSNHFLLPFFGFHNFLVIFLCLECFHIMYKINLN